VSAGLLEAKNAYERGELVTARMLYEKLAKDGHASALVFLARMYIDGAGGAVDLERAENLLNQAISLGIQEGVFQKASLFQARGDATGYFRSIRDASALGILPAQYRLALCYETGKGVAQDTGRSLEIMRVAAKRGHLGAQIFLGRRLLSNPLRLADFLSGLYLLVHATIKSVYQIFRDPYSDQLR